jgi:hypothetical protein
MGAIEKGVRLSWNIKHEGRNITDHAFYQGRDAQGTIKLTRHANLAAMMNEQTAKRLIEKLKVPYPHSEIASVIRGERDDLTATTLAELGEAPPAHILQLPSVAILKQALEQCLAAGVSRKDILLLVPEAI